jgi:hypothetical protein
MTVADWAPAIGATVAAVIALGSAVWVQIRTWRLQQRSRWDELTLNTYAAFLQEAGAAYDAAILIASNPLSPPPKCSKQFKMHYSAIEEQYEALVLLAPSSREHARRMMWTLWNVGKQTLQESQDKSLATRTYRDIRYHLRMAAQKQFKLQIPDHDLLSEHDSDAHKSPLAEPPESSAWHLRGNDSSVAPRAGD